MDPIFDLPANRIPHMAPALRPVTAEVLVRWPRGTFVENVTLLPPDLLAISIHSANCIELRHRDSGTLVATIELPQSPTGIVAVGDSLYLLTSEPGQSPATLYRWRAGSDLVAVLQIGGAKFANGLTRVGADRLLAADSILGCIHDLDLTARRARTWLEHPLLTKSSGYPYLPGINGIRRHRDAIYCTNTERAVVLRIALLPDGTPGELSVLAENLRGDDFAIDTKGALYLATHIENSLVRLEPNGTRTAIAGAAEGMAGSTAVALDDRAALPGAAYVTTTGGILGPVDGGLQEAKLVRLRIDATPAPALPPRPHPRVLLVVTSSGMIQGKPMTGVWLNEFAEPFVALAAAGCEITVASPNGGPAPVDPRSYPTAAAIADQRDSLASLNTTMRLADLDADDFDGVFVVGGHGPMFDLATDPATKRLLVAFHVARKPIAAVCHGVAALLGVDLGGGRQLLTGRRVTGFSEAEDRRDPLFQHMPFSLAAALRQVGADYRATAAGEAWVEVDALLVTGQNPASALPAARAFLPLVAAGE
jgi:putative intracellular protease/amidase